MRIATSTDLQFEAEALAMCGGLHRALEKPGQYLFTLNHVRREKQRVRQEMEARRIGREQRWSRIASGDLAPILITAAAQERVAA
jgi:hypothetical protein